jgi:eukaryotic-like serine/threonine-protein kinase
MKELEHQTEALGETMPRQGAPASASGLREGEILLERFKLVRLVGRGGMGEVYEARDLRLHTTVALKTVREAAGHRDALLERLRREVQLARGVTHPNVCRLFDLHEGPGPHGQPVAFVTMEFLDGETLADRLHRDGRMRARDALPLLQQMADGLAAIHARGLVHRDFKPGNVMLVGPQDGRRAVVTDLGIARSVGGDEDASGWESTEAGAIVGSPAYMAPEQRKGSQVTARADVHALAQVALEMVAGQDGLPGTPRAWRRTLRHAMDADPEQRPADPRALVRSLGATLPGRRLRIAAAVGAVVLLGAAATVLVLRRGPSSTLADRRAIAVLPLVNLGGDPADDYFADGLAEDINTQLTHVRSLRVTSRGATRALKGTTRASRDVAQELGVGSLLVGTVRRSGGRVRINTQLVDARTDQQLWAETYDRDVREVLDVQRDVASKVAGALALQLSEVQVAAGRPGATRSPEAYDFYLRGISKADDMWNTKLIRAAIADFERAVAIDPSYALAHAHLGLQLIRVGLFFERDPPPLLARGRAEVARALALEPELATPHLALGVLLFSEQGGWDLDGAMREFRRAEELEPGSAQMDIAAVALHFGLEDLSLRSLESARKRNPTSRAARGFVVETLTYSGRWREALARAQELDADVDGYSKVESLLRVGRAAEAMDWAFDANPEGDHLPDPPHPLIALTLVVAGKPEESAFLVGLFERGYPLERGNPAHHGMHELACAQALLGHPREAVSWLRKAAHAGLPNYPLFLRDPFLDSLRSDPEFVQFLAELKADWERRLQEYQ